LRRYLDRLDDIPLPNYVPGELVGKPVYQQVDHVGALRGGQFGFYPFIREMSPRAHHPGCFRGRLLGDVPT
jgi:hypothetical protein